MNNLIASLFLGTSLVTAFVAVKNLRKDNNPPAVVQTQSTKKSKKKKKKSAPVEKPGTEQETVVRLTTDDEGNLIPGTQGAVAPESPNEVRSSDYGVRGRINRAQSATSSRRPASVSSPAVH